MNNKILTNIEPKKLGFCMSSYNTYDSQIFAFGDTIDELVDSVISYQDIIFTNSFVASFIHLLSYTNLKKLETSILDFNDNNTTFYLLNFSNTIRNKSKIKDYDFSTIEKYFLESEDIYKITYLAQYASREYFNVVQDMVCNSDDAHLILTFSKNFHRLENYYDIDYNRLYEAIKKTKKQFLIVEFEVRILNRKPTLFEKFLHDNFD